MAKRRVDFYKYVRVEGQSFSDKVLAGEGTFHEFGFDYEDFETGPGNFSIAIIELDDGTIKSLPVEMIAFKD